MEMYAIAIVVIIIAIVVWYLYPMLTLSTEPAADSLYSRLGGIYPIAAIVNLFSDNILMNPLVGTQSPNPYLKAWSQDQVGGRMPGLKFMRTLWVADATGGPFTFHRSAIKECPFSGKKNSGKLNLAEAHCQFKITTNQFDAVAGELQKAMQHYKVGDKEQIEILDAFSAHKAEVVSV